jgi:hypothetical protein
MLLLVQSTQILVCGYPAEGHLVAQGIEGNQIFESKRPSVSMQVKSPQNSIQQEEYER